MAKDKKTLAVPILLITLGVGWLLTTMGIVPEVDWAWTLGLAIVGVLTFVLSGVDKVTVVVGPFFLVASCLSLLRQIDRLNIDKEVPILVIAAGVLLLVAHLPSIRAPGWLEPKQERSK